jgi:hypothetical protein
LLDAAVAAIQRHGPGASMDQLAAEAGVTKPLRDGWAAGWSLRDISAVATWGFGVRVSRKLGGWSLRDISAAATWAFWVRVSRKLTHPQLTPAIRPAVRPV